METKKNTDKKYKSKTIDETIIIENLNNTNS